MKSFYKKIKIKNNNFNYIKFNLSRLIKLIFENKNILITGGKSINYFIKKIFKNKNLIIKNKINFFLSDDRLFSINLDSNTNQLLRIFRNKKKINFFGYNNYPSKIDLEIKRYNKILPKRIDTAFLSLGSNYHIASLFPKMNVHYKTKKLIITSSANFEYLRISVNKNFLSNIKKIFIIINGKKRLEDFKLMIKKNILKKYFRTNAYKNITLILKNI